MKKQQLILAVSMVVAASTAGAEIFKCKGPDGKTVISDTRCENEAPKPAAAAPKDTSGRYQLTDADKARVKSLETLVDSKAANSEQKSAAQWEMSNIRMGADARLTPEDRAKREALVSQLAGADQKKRTELLGQIRTFYDK
jgi:hypothetical protein